MNVMQPQHDDIDNPSLPGISVVYNLEAVLMDLYITFFLFSFFLAQGGNFTLGSRSRPLEELLGPNLGIRGGFGP